MNDSLDDDRSNSRGAKLVAATEDGCHASKFVYSSAQPHLLLVLYCIRNCSLKQPYANPD
jgi:hypothetical protein